MLNIEVENKIKFTNFAYYKVNLQKFYEQSAAVISADLEIRFGKKRSYTIVAGLGGNGLDALYLAKEMMLKKFQNVRLYLVGRANRSNDEQTYKVYTEISKLIKNNLNHIVQQDVYANDIESSDIVIEGLVGTGLLGKALNKRFQDVVKRISHFSAKLIAIDIPAPHYKPDVVYSLEYPKVENSFVVDVKYPAEIENLCGPGELDALWEPKSGSHKNKNAKVLFLSEDLGNLKCIKDGAMEYLASVKTFDLIKDDKNKLEELLEETDTVIFGIIKDNVINRGIVKYILENYCDKAFVAYDSSVCTVDDTWINGNNISFIISRQELSDLLKEKSSTAGLEGRLKRFCVENQVNVVLLGSQSVLYSSDGEMKLCKTTNIYSDGFKDYLTGMTAAFAAKNDMWLSLRAGVFGSGS